MARLGKPLFVLILMLLLSQSQSEESESEHLKPDPKGYALFFPGASEFAHAVDTYLGSVSFIVGLGRILVLPPFYIKGKGWVPFDTYFQPEGIERFYGEGKVMLMEEFMEKLAPTVWPEEKRISFCRRFMRGGSIPKDCNAKFHKQNQEFWADVEFSSSIAYGNLHYETRSGSPEGDKWRAKYPAEDYPVLAFSIPPAKFPIIREDVELHVLLNWTENIKSKAAEFIKQNLPDTFLALDLSHRDIFEKSCALINKHNMRQIMASPQCLGYRNERGELKVEYCNPSDNAIVDQVVPRVTEDAMFITGVEEDADIVHRLRDALPKVRIVLSTSDPVLDLAVLEQADHFIGNCVSYYTSFVVRARRMAKKPVEFLVYNARAPKDEL